MSIETLPHPECRMAVLPDIESVQRLRDIIAEVRGGTVASCSIVTCKVRGLDVNYAIIVFLEAEGLRTFLQDPPTGIIDFNGDPIKNSIFVPTTTPFPFWERPSMQNIIRSGRTRCLVAENFDLHAFPELWLELGLNTSFDDFVDIYFDSKGGLHIEYREIEKASRTYDRVVQGSRIGQKYGMRFEADPCARPAVEAERNRHAAEHSILVTLNNLWPYYCFRPSYKGGAPLREVADCFIVSAVMAFKPRWPDGLFYPRERDFGAVVQHVASRHEALTSRKVVFRDLYERMLPFILVPVVAFHAKLGRPALDVLTFIRGIDFANNGHRTRLLEYYESPSDLCYEEYRQDYGRLNLFAAPTAQAEKKKAPTYPDYAAYDKYMGEGPSVEMSLQEFNALTDDEWRRLGTVFESPRQGAGPDKPAREAASLALEEFGSTWDETRPGLDA